MKIEQKLKIYILSKYKSIRQFVETTDKEIDKISKQINKLISLYSMDGIPLDLLQRQIDDLNNKKTALLKRTEKKKTIYEVKTIIGSLDDILYQGSFEDIRTVITSLIAKIIISGDDVIIIWKF